MLRAEGAAIAQRCGHTEEESRTDNAESFGCSCIIAMVQWCFPSRRQHAGTVD